MLVKSLENIRHDFAVMKIQNVSQNQTQQKKNKKMVSLFIIPLLEALNSSQYEIVKDLFVRNISTVNIYAQNKLIN